MCHLLIFWREDFKGIIALFEVTAFTSEGQIINPIGASLTFRDNVINLERNFLSIAVSAGSSPFFKEVLFHFVAKESSLLVFDPLYLGILKLLSIEADLFKSQRGDRSPLFKTPNPCEDVIHTLLH